MLYLDNNATTPIAPEVLDEMLPYLKEEYGNPSSRHYTLARNAEKAVETAREKVASLINAKSNEIIFTAGSSESNNFIIKGIADYKKYYEESGNHIITSVAEHKSVLQTCHYLAGTIYDNKSTNRATSQLLKSSPKAKTVDRGYLVTFLPVNSNSQVELSLFEKSIQKNTILASFIWANNETGALNDIQGLLQIANTHKILFHTDATQAIGKIDLNVINTPIDYMSFSAHKLYGPKGVGAAYIRQSNIPQKITSLIHGGQQEFGYRAGTLAVHNIVGFGKACEIAKNEHQRNIEKLRILEKAVKKLFVEKYPDIIFIADTCAHVPGVISMIIPGIVNELLIKKLSDSIALSSGSACGIGEPSYVIKESGYGDRSNNFLRISFNKYQTVQSIESLLMSI